MRDGRKTITVEYCYRTGYPIHRDDARRLGLLCGSGRPNAETAFIRSYLRDIELDRDVRYLADLAALRFGSECLL